MNSPEELILNGQTPTGESAVPVGTTTETVKVGEVATDDEVIRVDLSKDAQGHLVFADLKQQVAYDWKHLNSSQVRAKKNANAQYAAALADFLNGTTTASETTQVDSAVPTQVESVAPAQVLPAVVPVPAATPVVDEEETGDPNLVKTAKGWEYRVDLGDGSGVQVFKGKTQREVIAALGKAQVNATKKIRQQEQERKTQLINEPADVESGDVTFAPRAATADEQWQISQDLQDPAKAAKALDRYLEIRLGGKVEQVVEKLNAHDNDLAYRRASNEVKAFLAETPDFYNTPDNRITLANYVEENQWAATKRNVRKAFLELEAADKFPDKRPEEVSTPESETVSTESTREAAPAAVVAPAPAVSVQPALASTSQPAGLPDGTRMRPGSSSTGMSPRQASVRSGGPAPAQPVGLTVEEYRRIPAGETRLRYQRDPNFKAQVDKLISEGKI